MRVVVCYDARPALSRSAPAAGVCERHTGAGALAGRFGTTGALRRALAVIAANVDPSAIAVAADELA